MAKYKFKLSELAKTASEKDAEKELDKPRTGFAVGQVTISDDGTTKSTITDIDDETGAVRWKVEQLPGFDKLYDDLSDLVSTAKRTYVKTKDDKKFRDFYDEIRVIRNKVRTHLRNEYPDQYKRITRIGEDELSDLKVGGVARVISNIAEMHRDLIHRFAGITSTPENFSSLTSARNGWNVYYYLSFHRYIHSLVCIQPYCVDLKG